MAYHTALALGVLIPLIGFAILALFGHRLGKPRSSYVALAAVGLSCLLASWVLSGWLGATADQRAELAQAAREAQFHWADFGTLPIEVHVNLDSLTVIMYFMVTFISFWIFFFSIGYMEGHSDEVDGTSKYHRFFCYLSLFCFSMLGLVVASSLLFLFIFWELVGLCSYLLIGFYFDKKFASNAAMKAFIANRVGDFGFLFGVMLVVMFLGTFDLDQAAHNFAEQYHADTGVFAASFELFGWHVSGMTIATLMGVGLFCGAIGKSAQFPLHVWLPDAMAGPTPVSALIHAATMVAAGVYLVARIFRLLTPDAQMFVAVIGCITLTLTALIAVVQTDIKKVLAYSTLSQLGYMIFGLGVGAWIAALFHLMVHAFFKAMLFLCSGQVIEGCHHEQDIRKMGGLRKKMPKTCWTFFVGLLAISGFGIPFAGVGLGGYFSKDEILAVAYERAFNWPIVHEEHDEPEYAASARFESRNVMLVSDSNGTFERSADSEHETPHEQDHHTTGTPEKLRIAAGVGALPSWLFWLPIIIAYVTPFYMMRCWWLTFCGKPRDDPVYEHAHENWKMWVPLVVLAAGTIWCSYWLFRPLIADAARSAADATAVVAIDGEAHGIEEAGAGAMMTLTHTVGHNPHQALGWIVGFAWIIGIGLAWALYRRGLDLAERLRRVFPLNLFHHWLEQKLYFDHVYDNVVVGGTVVVAFVMRAFDNAIVDGIVKGTAFVTRVTAVFTGRQLDMPVRRGDIGLIDGVANTAARATLSLGQTVRRPQNGRIRTYIVFAAGTAAAALLVVLFSDQLRTGFDQLMGIRTAAALP
ncbi:MAG: NADH-quinone oxidoreductase subunit L [Phycisphaerae bacterium]